MIQRYKLLVEDVPTPDNDGEWVHWKDVEELQEKYCRIKKANDKRCFVMETEAIELAKQEVYEVMSKNCA